MKSSIYFFVFLALSVSSGWGLQCYTCDSIASENCNDPYTPGAQGSWISDCGEANNKGSGATHELLHKHFPGVSEPQADDYLGSKNCDVLTTALEANGGRMETCESCDEALCNSGVKFGISLVFSAILVFLVRLLM
ncbi:hypothetical protein B566_EDAN014916 [Ephemera danica]|nr:hypothetical protein B566_EDAN014916 [Ephemera danica]